MDRLVAEVETKKEKVVEEKTAVLTEDKTEEKIEIFETKKPSEKKQMQKRCRNCYSCLSKNA